MTNPFIVMEQHKSQFTKNDLKIYETILDNPDLITYLSTSKMAEKCGVSQPAITRFVKTLGYSRHQDFRSDVIAWLAQQNPPSDSGRLFYFEKLEKLLGETEKVLTDEYLAELADYVLRFQRIFASGLGKSFHPALLLETLVRKEDIFVHTCRYDTLSEYADHLKEEDLMIIFSVSAQPSILKKIKNTNGKVMLVTVNSGHEFQKYIDRTVLLPYVPRDPEASSISPVLFDIFVELLVNYISNRLSAEAKR